MKMTLPQMLVVFAVCIAALPLLVIAVLLQAMNTQIAEISDTEFTKIAVKSVRQVIGDTSKICQIINKTQTESSEVARAAALSRFAQLGVPHTLDSYYDVEISNQNNLSEKKKVRVKSFAFGDKENNIIIEHTGEMLSSSGDIKDTLETFKSDTGLEYSLLLRINANGDMLRISSTVRDGYGDEYIGTYIPASDDIAKILLSKRSYSGILHTASDMSFIATFDPIIDSNGEVIAALSSGRPLSSLDYVLKYFEGVRIGTNGYVWAIEVKNDATSIVRIDKENGLKGAIVERDFPEQQRNAALNIISSAVSQNENAISVKEYSVQLPDGNCENLITSYTYFRPWNMVFGATIYCSDFADSATRIGDNVGRFMLLLVPLGIIILALAAFVAYLAGERGTSMTNELSGAANMIENGNIALARARIERMIKSRKWSNLEIFEFGQSLLKMSGNLAKLVAKVQGGGENVAVAANKIAEAAAQIESMSVEKASAFRNVTGTVSNITNSVRLLKVGARVAAKSIDETLELMNSSGALLTQLKENASELSSATESSALRLSTIKERVDRIAESISVIKMVSARINMLSLNASVEAEKSGGYGMGFESVSREIRRLADIVDVSTIKISKMVETMRASIDTGSADMEVFAFKMRNSGRVIEKASSTLLTVREQVSTLGPKFEKLADGVDVEVANAVSISKTMLELSISAAKTRNDVAEFKLAADSLDENVEKMREKMSHFKLP